MLKRAGLLAGVALAASCNLEAGRGAAAAPPAAAGGAAAIPFDLAVAPGGEQAAAAPQAAIPHGCAAADADICVPPADFVEQLCASSHPEAAFTLFGPGSPYTRAYLRRKMEAWYASGGRARPRQLRYAEEVIIVADRAASAGGMRVSGAGSYDVFRWDGSCVSLMTDEVTLHRPANPDVATIAWRRLGDAQREVLTKNRKIEYRNDRRLQDCRHDKSSKRCLRARQGLSRMIAEYVRGGGEVPAPAFLR